MRTDYSLHYPSIDDKNCGKPCEVALNQLENIDDDAARHGIKFVKSSTPSKKIAIDSLPALIYFDDGQPIRYNGKGKFNSRVTTSRIISSSLLYSRMLPM